MKNQRCDPRGLTFEVADSLLRLDTETGKLYLKESLGPNAPAGAEPGYVKAPYGYRHMTIRGRKYYAHNLVWLLHFGQWPTAILDHRDGDPGNNRISNLRLCEGPIVNQHNQKRPPRSNKSGFTGVSFDAKMARFKATIQLHGQAIHLGFFEKPEDGHVAYMRAKAQLHPASLS